VGGGTYAESIELRRLKGTKEKPILIHAGGDAHITATGRDGILLTECSRVTIAGFKITGAERAGILVGGSDHVTVSGCICGDNGVWGIQTAMCSHITVEKCELYGSKREHGIYFSTTEYPTATDNHVHDNAGCGIHFNGDVGEGGDGVITGAIVRRNKILRNGKTAGGAAINLDGVEKSTIESNVIDGNFAGGITSFKGDAKSAGSGNVFSRNVVRFEPGVGRYGIQLFAGSTKATVTQNIISIANGPSVEIDKASIKGFTASGNLYAGKTDEVRFSLDDKTLTFAEWQQATGQDADSHVAVMPTAETMPSPPGQAP
jgi:hypothetical protein